MKKTPTSPENLAIINKMFKELEEPLNNLSFRWACEREYEDFKEYGEVIKKLLPPQVIMKDMSKRPFGFRFRIKGFEEALYHIKVTTRTYGWDRVE